MARRQLLGVIPRPYEYHSHIPQYPMLTKRTSELLPWLRQHIFPVERRSPVRKGESRCDETVRHSFSASCDYTDVYEKRGMLTRKTVLARIACICRSGSGKRGRPQVMDYRTLLPYLDAPPEEITAEDILSLCVYRGGRGGVVETFVRGRQLDAAPAPGLF